MIHQTNSEKKAFEAIVGLYSHQPDRQEQAYEILQKCRINASFDPQQVMRQDLQFFVPQLISFYVLHKEFRAEELYLLLRNASILDFHFGHLCYFYMRSVGTTQEVNKFIQQSFLPEMVKQYQSKTLFSVQLVSRASFEIHRDKFDQQATKIARKYGTGQLFPQLKINNFELNKFHESSFMATPSFLSQLILISKKISRSPNKIQVLKSCIRDLNGRLPASVYIPFYRQSLRNYCVLNIDQDSCKVFSTKQRAPYYICLQVFRPQETYFGQIPRENFRSQRSKIFNSMLLPPERNQYISYDYKVSMPIVFKKSEEKQEEVRTRKMSVDVFRESQFQSQQKQVDLQFEQANKMSFCYNSDNFPLVNLARQSDQGKVFGESQEELSERIREESVFGGLQSWRLVHLIIKTGDDLRQEQFAMQLIYLFNQIFQKEKLKLFLRPYQVISLGSDQGIIEMIPDVVTMDTLKRRLYEKNMTLLQFFQFQFKKDVRGAIRNFRSSLAAYCLVTYFLQIKDRHNGNILLSADGKIIHIDYGFLLSSNPGGKLQKDVPFKLLSEYVDVMGGVHSRSFEKFRALFSKGFKAVVKNKEKILSLVKIMFTSHSSSMKCFVGGRKAIDSLQQRLSPPNTRLQFSSHCNQLINRSLDNWRAKWYDKYQYWFQGIVY